jgi:hypothetical protein
MIGLKKGGWEKSRRIKLNDFGAPDKNGEICAKVFAQRAKCLALTRFGKLFGAKRALEAISSPALLYPQNP